MKPSKVRLARRAQLGRLAVSGFELERAANRFNEVRHESAPCIRSARLDLYQAAISFAATVDGEDTEQLPAKVVPMRAAK